MYGCLFLITKKHLFMFVALIYLFISTNGGDEECIYDIGGKPQGKRPLGRPNVRGWTILKLILERWDGMVWAGSIWLTIGTSGGLL
jgi:hypothetical protein